MTQTWQEYQQEVAQLLYDLGFAVSVDDTITGARGVHNIDVSARLNRAGVSQLWIAECKLWRRRVPKERVLTFLGVVSDVGADRGLMFSESGFQAGAVRAAKHTNVTLTSVADMREEAADELLNLKVSALEKRIEDVSSSLLSLSNTRRAGNSSVTTFKTPIIRNSARGPETVSPISLMGRLSFLETNLAHARRGEPPLLVPTWNEDVPQVVGSLDLFLQKASQLISEAEEMVEAASDLP